MTSLDSYPMERTQPHGTSETLTYAHVREIIGLIFAPATDYAESSAPGRRLDDLEAALHIPVDLASHGWVCRVAPGPNSEGFEVVATRPAGDGLPIITGKANADTWCECLCEVAYTLHARLDRLEAQLARDAMEQTAA
jgi:hypothetical protein